MTKITPQATLPTADQSPPTSNLGKTGPAANVQPSKADGVGKAAPHDPLLRLRDEFIRTSAHAAHPTAGEVATTLKDVEKFANGASFAASTITALPTFVTAYTQDGDKIGKYFGQATLDAGVSFIGTRAGAALGAEIGEAAGAFVGGAFGGIGALPGAVLGGIAGGFVGGYVGCELALHDSGAIKNRIEQHHG